MSGCSCPAGRPIETIVRVWQVSSGAPAEDFRCLQLNRDPVGRTATAALLISISSTLPASVPDWLNDEHWAQLDRVAHFDIDTEPIRFLAALIAEREPDSRGAAPAPQHLAVRSPWKAGGLLGGAAGLVVALIMHIAWHHNTQGEIHDESGIS